MYIWIDFLEMRKLGVFGTLTNPAQYLLTERDRHLGNFRRRRDSKVMLVIQTDTRRIKELKVAVQDVQVMVTKRPPCAEAWDHVGGGKR